MHPAAIDWTIMGVYFAFVLGIGSSPAIYQRLLGLDINLWWGAALLAFGIAMLALAWRAASRASSAAARMAGTQ